MKTSQIIVTVVLIAIIGTFIAFWAKQKPVEVPNPPATSQVESIKGCYVATLAKDVYTLKVLSQTGENFIGTLEFKNFQKDSSSGTYVGTYKDGILLGDYAFRSEGMDSVMQVIFKKIGNDFVRGYGDLTATGDRFTDISKVTFDNAQTFKPDPNCAL